jgi:hypothetical protein
MKKYLKRAEITLFPAANVIFRWQWLHTESEALETVKYAKLRNEGKWRKWRRLYMSKKNIEYEGEELSMWHRRESRSIAIDNKLLEASYHQ